MRVFSRINFADLADKIVVTESANSVGLANFPPKIDKYDRRFLDLFMIKTLRTLKFLVKGSSPDLDPKILIILAQNYVDPLMFQGLFIEATEDCKWDGFFSVRVFLKGFSLFRVAVTTPRFASLLSSFFIKREYYPKKRFLRKKARIFVLRRKRFVTVDELFFLLLAKCDDSFEQNTSAKTGGSLLSSCAGNLRCLHVKILS